MSCIMTEYFPSLQTETKALRQSKGLHIDGPFIRRKRKRGQRNRHPLKRPPLATRPQLAAEYAVGK
jgi:N-acetylglucosamine-6-phosphate deacetylase